MPRPDFFVTFCLSMPSYAPQIASVAHKPWLMHGVRSGRVQIDVSVAFRADGLPGGAIALDVPLGVEWCRQPGGKPDLYDVLFVVASAVPDESLCAFGEHMVLLKVRCLFTCAARADGFVAAFCSGLSTAVTAAAIVSSGHAGAQTARKPAQRAQGQARPDHRRHRNVRRLPVCDETLTSENPSSDDDDDLGPDAEAMGSDSDYDPDRSSCSSWLADSDSDGCAPSPAPLATPLRSEPHKSHRMTILRCQWPREEDGERESDRDMPETDDEERATKAGPPTSHVSCAHAASSWQLPQRKPDLAQRT